MNIAKIQRGGELLLEGALDARSVQLACASCAGSIVGAPVAVVWPRAATRKSMIVDVLFACSDDCAREYRKHLAEREARAARRAAHLSPLELEQARQARLLERLYFNGSEEEAEAAE